MLIGLFVNFVFANSVFVHAHSLDDGFTIWHSHPYGMGGNHTHSTQSLQQIAQSNLVASSALMSAVLTLGCIQSYVRVLEPACVQRIVAMRGARVYLRGPPSERIAA